MSEPPRYEPYQQELDVALQAVRTAAQVCRSVQATITPHVLEKQDRSPVTVADFGSQAVICRALKQAFPQDPVMAEEDAAAIARTENDSFLTRIDRELQRVGLHTDPTEICRWIDHGGTEQYSGRFWALDPIDGTKGFLRKEQYAISLSLIVDGQIEVALLGCPNLPLAVASAAGNRSSGSGDAPPSMGTPADEQFGPTGAVFYAVRGRGCRVVPLDTDAHAAEVYVSRTAETAAARFCESVETGHTSHQVSAEVSEILGIERPPHRLDSQAKYAVVARGEADIYLRLPSRSGYRQKVWDHAGGVLIVEEAGGTVTDVAGAPLDWTHGTELTENRGVIATNGLLHERVLAALKQVGVC